LPKKARLATEDDDDVCALLITILCARSMAIKPPALVMAAAAIAAAAATAIENSFQTQKRTQNAPERVQCTNGNSLVRLVTHQFVHEEDWEQDNVTCYVSSRDCSSVFFRIST
jgi:hypothetical protein